MATRLRQMLPEVALSLSWVQLAAVLAALLLATKLVSLVLRRRRLAAATLAVGGGPIPKLPSCDRWLGLDNSLALLRHLRQHTLLPLVEGWFTEQALRLATKEIGETRVKGDRGTEDEKRGSHSVSPAGWTLSVNIFGDESVWTADPDNVRAVLATNAKDWSIGRMRVDAFDPLFGPNIITSDGEAWQASRSIMRPSFARSQINDTERFARYYEHFRRRIPDDGKMTVDLAPLFYMFSMDVSSELLFDASTNTLTDDGAGENEGIKFSNAFDLVLERVVRRNMLGWLAVLFPDRQFDAAVAYLRRFADEYVKVALETWSPDASKDDDTNKAKDKADRYVFLHEMFRSWADRPARIRSEQLALMAGGRDTTATALTNCVHLLARAPDVWAKVRAECLALDVDQGGETTTIPTYEQLRTRLTYLSSVVRESLRLRPPVTDVTRTSLVDTVLPRGGGKDGMSPVFVAKGTNLRLWPYVVQRRRDLWGDDAHEFRPERWSDGSGAPGFADQAGGLRPGFAYVPFGGGPRICLGQQLALTEITYVLYRLAREFGRIEPADPDVLWQGKMGLTASSLHGAKVRLIPAARI